jgi:hypothetical protein
MSIKPKFVEKILEKLSEVKILFQNGKQAVDLNETKKSYYEDGACTATYNFWPLCL